MARVYTVGPGLGMEDFLTEVEPEYLEMQSAGKNGCGCVGLCLAAALGVVVAACVVLAVKKSWDARNDKASAAAPPSFYD